MSFSRDGRKSVRSWMIMLTSVLLWGSTIVDGTPVGPATTVQNAVGQVATTITQTGTTIDYCALFGSDNTMCKYKTANSKCSRVQGAPTINQTTIAGIVSVHNTLRANVANGQQSGQPAASNMRQMIWNAEMATVAQRWADQCIFGHDKDRLTPAFPKSVGQNVAYSSEYPNPPALNFTWAITEWYNEVKDYTPGSNNVLKFSEKTGHYTQVVWANSYAVGCGFAQYLEGSYTTNLYVCNYGPAGNVLTLPVYLVGKACSACDAGVQCSTQYPGLCATSA